MMIQTTIIAAMSIAGYQVSTKTLAGWGLGIAILLLAYRVISVMRDASNDRDAEQRNEKLKMAWITLACGLGVVVVLERMGLVSFAEITQSLDSF